MRLLLAILLAAAAFAAPRPLDVYVIDVEGGKAMLVVSPSGESMLVDAGWPGYSGRDVGRIVAAAREAKVKRIDYLVITHLDIDHIGDLKLLASKLPVVRVIDNGPLQTTGKGVEKRYKAYAETRDAMEHTTVRAGDRIPIKGVQVDVIAAGTKFIAKPLEGGGIPNPACAAAPQPAEIPEDLEDNMSIGLLFTFGRFRMIDLADLESHYDYKLMCPTNPVGTVDVYQVSVHGQEKGGSAALVGGLRPRVAIMANGARKGGDPQAWPRLRGAPGLEDIWQLHYSLAGGRDRNPPEAFVANLDPDCQGKSIKLSAQTDGTFTVTNLRNNFSRTYQVPPDLAQDLCAAGEFPCRRRFLPSWTVQRARPSGGFPHTDRRGHSPNRRTNSSIRSRSFCQKRPGEGVLPASNSDTMLIGGLSKSGFGAYAFGMTDEIAVSYFDRGTLMPRLIDLSHPLAHGQPNFAWDPKISVVPHNTVRSIGYNITHIGMSTHQGTHVDAPYHFFDDGATIDCIPLQSFYGRAVLIDLAPDECLAPKSPVTLEMFESHERAFQPGARIIYRTGWDRVFGHPEFFSEFPSLTLEAARFCADRKIALLGMDTPTPSADWLECHHILLGKGTEIVILEGLANLNLLPREFTLMAFPLRIEGRDGSPVRAVALVDANT